MPKLHCKIKSGIGEIHSLSQREVTTLDETFPRINRDKYIGLSVKVQSVLKSDSIYIAYHSIVENSFKENNFIIEKDRLSLQLTANWMLPYEKSCLAICKDILGKELSTQTLYSMDLPRFLEKLIENNYSKKKV